jgi:hypothetical protein
MIKLQFVGFADTIVSCFVSPDKQHAKKVHAMTQILSICAGQYIMVHAVLHDSAVRDTYGEPAFRWIP